jgi:hypothetical protein
VGTAFNALLTVREENDSIVGDNLMVSHQRRRLAYLVRLWPVRSGSQTVWRASLENPHTGEILGFASLERLFAFLEDQTAALAETEEMSRLTFVQR